MRAMSTPRDRVEFCPGRLGAPRIACDEDDARALPRQRSTARSPIPDVAPVATIVLPCMCDAPRTRRDAAK
jgi:hypothetical protein